MSKENEIIDGETGQLLPRETTSLVPVTTAVRLLPTGIDEAYRLAQYAHSSGYCNAKSPESALWRMMRGMELGFAPAQAIASVHDIKGTLTLSAAAMAAVCKRSPICRFFMVVETSAERCVCRTQRVGDPDPTEIIYTIEDARRAGLANKDIWRAHPADMLAARAQSRLARLVYPDIISGLYTEDEAREIAEREEREQAQNAPRPQSPVKTAQPQPQPAKSAPPMSLDKITQKSLKTYHPQTQEEWKRAMSDAFSAYGRTARRNGLNVDDNKGGLDSAKIRAIFCDQTGKKWDEAILGDFATAADGLPDYAAKIAVPDAHLGDGEEDNSIPRGEKLSDYDRDDDIEDPFADDPKPSPMAQGY